MGVRIVLLLKDVIQALDRVDWLVIHLMNFHGLDDVPRFFGHGFLELWVVNPFLFVWALAELLFQGHLGCELVDFCENLFGGHGAQVFLAGTHGGDLWVQVNVLYLLDLLENLSLWDGLRSFIVVCTMCGSGRSVSGGVLMRWGSSRRRTSPQSLNQFKKVQNYRAPWERFVSVWSRLLSPAFSNE